MLSILIPTVPQRSRLLIQLLDELNKQIQDCSAFDVVEIITDDAPVGSKSTGQKRNDLLDKANNKYVWFIDDDDMVMKNAISNILKALNQNPDALGINGIITTDGVNPKKWYISKDLEYMADTINGNEVYLRPTNHITPVKKEIAQAIRFEHKSNFEDYEYCMKLKNAGLIKTEVKIDEPVYHYQYLSTNKLY